MREVLVQMFQAAQEESLVRETEFGPDTGLLLLTEVSDLQTSTDIFWLPETSQNAIVLKQIWTQNQNLKS